LEGHIATLQTDLVAEREARSAAERQRDEAFADLRAERERSAAEAVRLHAALEAAAADIRTERNRADHAEQARDGERARADAATSQAQAERARTEMLDQKLAADRARADKAERVVDQFQTAAQQALQAAETANSDRRAAEIAREEEQARTDGLKRLLEATQLELAEQRALTDQAEAARQEALQAAETVRQIDEARKVRGRWARLRAAWLGR
jgi:hypothetical protein